MHVTEKKFLAMIKDFKFVYDLDKPEVEDASLGDRARGHLLIGTQEDQGIL